MILGHLDGAVFLGAFAGYIFYMIRTAMKARTEGKKVEIEAVEELEDGELKLLSYPKSILCIVGGAVAIAFGGDMTVDAASRIAIDLGMSQTLVGLTIVSIGTSLPELVTSVVAARKNEVDMAVGNAVGSNIFNILMVLGIASAISPVSLISENVIDILVLVGFSVVVWFFARSDRKITRNEGYCHGGNVSDLHGIYYYEMTAIRYGNCRHLQINLNSCSFCVMIDQNLDFIKLCLFFTL